MSKIVKVFLREDGISQDVYMTSDDKPSLTDDVTDNWQRMINMLEVMMSVKACLINTLSEENIEILLSSENSDNPYNIGLCDSLGQGTYCEMVVGKNQPLEIYNVQKNDYWKNSPYSLINMISYYGLPIQWPDGEVFGTLCVLDNKENHFSNMFKDIFMQLKFSVEKDLESLVLNQRIKILAEQDGLTKVYNRARTQVALQSEFDRSKRSNAAFSVVLFDIDNFKKINDKYGHDKADQILVMFAQLLKSHIRKTDILGRWGNDEFLVICPGTSYDGAHTLISKVRQDILYELIQVIREINYSYGTATYKGSDKKIEDIIKRADHELNDAKKINRVE